MTKYIKCIICCMLIVVLLCGCTSNALYVETETTFNWNEIENDPFDHENIKRYEELNICYGPVETSEEAAIVAQEYWVTIYDRDDILAQTPYEVSYDEKNRVWKVAGNPEWLKKKFDGPAVGGEAFIWISQDDGRILLCFHTE